MEPRTKLLFAVLSAHSIFCRYAVFGVACSGAGHVPTAGMQEKDMWTKEIPLDIDVV